MNTLLKEDQPRYKAENLGMASLSTSELICVMLSGSTNNHLETSRKLLEKTNCSINELAKLSLNQLCEIKGIGKSKAVVIAAAFELAKRKSMEKVTAKTILRSSVQIAEYLQAYIGAEPVEKFVVLFLNRANKIQHTQIISTGGYTGTVADPRVILKLALEHNACSLVLAHNHPSGNLKPSTADEQITNKIKQAAAYFDIKILDHIVVSEEGYYSFADEGILL